MRKRLILVPIFIFAVIGIGIIFFFSFSQKTAHVFQRWRNDININAIESKYTGKGIKIALIDTGVDTKHPDLINSSISTIMAEEAKENNNYEHGTAMAGIIVGFPVSENGILGVAPNAELISIDFSDKNADEVEKLIEAIEIAIEYEADIINISMGIDVDSDGLHEAVKNAFEKNIIIVAAAGNGENGKALYPAKYSEVICVGAIDKDGIVMFNESAMDDITILAPGKNVLTTFSSSGKEEKYISADGSSPAAAIVSGCIALLMECNDDITTDLLIKYFIIQKKIDVSKLIRDFG